MDSKKMKHDGNLCRKRKRMLESLDRDIESQMQPFNQAGGAFPTLPDLGIDVTPEEASNLLISSASNDPNPDNSEDEWEDVEEENITAEDYDQDEEDGPYSFVNYLSLTDALRHAAVTYRLSSIAVGAILAIIRKNTNGKVPKASRTLMKTPYKVGSQIKQIANGRLWYYGIEKVILNYFENVIPEVSQFTVDVSIDGLPLFKSSRQQLWPIQIRVVELGKHPMMVVGTFGGRTKPGNLDEFLRPLVLEINDLQRRGFRFGEKMIPFRLRAFIADSPMRATLKATMNFNARHGCLKCTAVGRTIKPGSKVVFATTNATPRTDAGFRSRVDREHHKEWRTPLEDLHDFNMIDGVPVGDRLHLIDEGATKKLLTGLLDHKFPNLENLSRKKESISNFLVKTRLPVEIPRRMRHLNEIPLYKATEFRTFLHYLSPVVFRNCMTNEVFNHFLHYFCAVTIFSSRAHERHWPLAKRLLDDFVHNFGAHYGQCHLTSNIHNLQHVAEEVEKFGTLDEFSAYVFENNLRFVKSCVRSGTKIVEQVAGRLYELGRIKKASYRIAPVYPKLKRNGSFRVTEDFLLGPSFQNRWFLTKEKSIVKFVKAKKTSLNSYIVYGHQIEVSEELFRLKLAGDDDLSSTELYIFKTMLNVQTRPVEMPYSNILCKLVPVFIPSPFLSRPSILPIIPPDSLALFPLLHTFQ